MIISQKVKWQDQRRRCNLYLVLAQDHLRVACAVSICLVYSKPKKAREESFFVLLLLSKRFWINHGGP